jgi:hypothetical protein
MLMCRRFTSHDHAIRRRHCQWRGLMLRGRLSPAGELLLASQLLRSGRARRQLVPRIAMPAMKREDVSFPQSCMRWIGSAPRAGTASMAAPTTVQASARPSAKNPLCGRSIALSTAGSIRTVAA